MSGIVQVPAQGCPSCAGAVMPGHPSGWLAIDHRNWCGLRDAEDQTHAADRHRLDYGIATEQITPVRNGLLRPTTEVEHVLLTALGHEPAEDATTRVTRVTRAVIRRTWPDLEVEAEPA